MSRLDKRLRLLDYARLRVSSALREPMASKRTFELVGFKPSVAAELASFPVEELNDPDRCCELFESIATQEDGPIASRERTEALNLCGLSERQCPATFSFAKHLDAMAFPVEVLSGPFIAASKVRAALAASAEEPTGGAPAAAAAAASSASASGAGGAASPPVIEIGFDPAAVARGDIIRAIEALNKKASKSGVCTIPSDVDAITVQSPSSYQEYYELPEEFDVPFSGVGDFGAGLYVVPLRMDRFIVPPNRAVDFTVWFGGMRLFLDRIQLYETSLVMQLERTSAMAVARQAYSGTDKDFLGTLKPPVLATTTIKFAEEATICGFSFSDPTKATLLSALLDADATPAVPWEHIIRVGWGKRCTSKAMTRAAHVKLLDATAVVGKMANMSYDASKLRFILNLPGTIPGFDDVLQMTLKVRGTEGVGTKSDGAWSTCQLASVRLDRGVDDWIWEFVQDAMVGSASFDQVRREIRFLRQESELNALRDDVAKLRSHCCFRFCFC